MLTTYANHELTKHAEKQMQRRSISSNELSLLLQYGDMEKSISKTTYALSISRRAVSDLVTEGLVETDRSGRIARLTVLLSKECEAVVTTFRRRGRHGQHYVQNSYRA